MLSLNKNSRQKYPVSGYSLFYFGAFEVIKATLALMKSRRINLLLVRLYSVNAINSLKKYK